MKKKKILFLCPYPKDKAPSQRLKFEQYFEEFEKDDFEIHFNSFMSLKFWDIVYKPKNYFKKFFYTLSSYIRRLLVLINIKKYDVVYVHLWVTPLGPPFFEYFLRLLHPKIIYDIDDLVFLGHTSKSNKFISFLKGKSKMIYLMKKADHIITCTPYLDKFVRQYNPATTDISSTVDTSKRYVPLESKINNNQINIGWSGSHSTSKYLYIIQSALQELAKEIDFKLIVMGDKSFSIDGVNVEALEWIEHIEIDTLNRFDIGLYPLPFEEWVLGKSGLKAIQYMALGIPTVATDVGTINRIISNGTSGYLIENNDLNLWKETLLKLILSEDLRRNIGLKSREVIVNEFSIISNKGKYLKVLNI